VWKTQAAGGPPAGGQLGYIVNSRMLRFRRCSVAVIVFFCAGVMRAYIVELKLKADGSCALTHEVIARSGTRLGLTSRAGALATADSLVTWYFCKSRWTAKSVAYEISISFDLSLETPYWRVFIAVAIAMPLGTGRGGALQRTAGSNVVRVSIAGMAGFCRPYG